VIRLDHDQFYSLDGSTGLGRVSCCSVTYRLLLILLLSTNDLRYVVTAAARSSGIIAASAE